MTDSTNAKLRELRERVAARVADFDNWWGANRYNKVIGSTEIAKYFDRVSMSVRDKDMLDLIDAMIQEAGE